ncbi:MAG: hypothetical protein ACI91F_002724, partial [Candidatus Binatia bacterium]
RYDLAIPVRLLATTTASRMSGQSPYESWK